MDNYLIDNAPHFNAVRHIAGFDEFEKLSIIPLSIILYRLFH